MNPVNMNLNSRENYLEVPVERKREGTGEKDSWKGDHDDDALASVVPVGNAAVIGE